jgi:hypothetical protein
MSKSTVHCHLRQGTRWKSLHLKCVPHTLIGSEKVNGRKDQQDFVSLDNRLIRKDGRVLAHLASPGFIEKSIWSNNDFQRMMN